MPNDSFLAAHGGRLGGFRAPDRRPGPLPIFGIRKRAAGQGVEALDTLELLALVVGPGAWRRAGERLGTARLSRLARAETEELTRDLGLPPAAATRLAASFALGRRAGRSNAGARPSLRHPERVYELLGQELRGLERETFHVLLLDGKHALRRRELVSVGTLTSSLVHPREVFRSAVREAAAALICVHNHPSGDPEPSPEDLEVTRRLIRSGRLVGIPLLDHVVIGDGRWVSLRERMTF